MNTITHGERCHLKLLPQLLPGLQQRAAAECFARSRIATFVSSG